MIYHHKKRKGRKAELTKELPIEEVHCELQGEDKICETCGEQMKWIGKKVIREEVCFILDKIYKKVYYSHAYACDCHDDTYEAKPIRWGETPKGPIQRSLAGQVS